MTPDRRSWKLIDLLDTTVQYFKQKEIASPRVDAELLLAHLLDKQRIELYASFDQPLTKGEVDDYRERVRRRGRGEPVQRITGETEFYSLRMKVLDGVFIPRPETELLVDAAIAWLKGSGGGEGRCAFDAGTGSGAIAVAILHSIPGLVMHAADLNRSAVDCAAENARIHSLSERLTLWEGDCVEHLEKGSTPYSLIVSNPPYITTAEMKELPREVGEYDPELALHGGEDGLDLYRRLIPAAGKALPRDGALVMELSDTVCPAVLNLLEDDRRFGTIGVRNDYSGHRRVVTAPRG